MASLRQLIVFGAAITFAALVFGNQTPLPFEPSDEFFECKQKTLVQREVEEECLSKHFYDEATNVSQSWYNKTRCPLCKLLCSKKDLILSCIGEAWDVLTSASNKSVAMVPFLRSLVEESLHSLCANDAELLSVLFDEEYEDCITNAWRTCRPRLEGAGDFNRIAFCDFADVPEKDPYSKQFICQKYVDLFECGEVETGKCTEELKTSVTEVITLWKNETSCSKYL